jgi:hypothetical protein
MVEKKDNKKRTISLEDELATWNIITYKINVIFTKTDLNKILVKIHEITFLFYYNS